MSIVNTKKACQDGDIPVKLIKMNEDIFSTLIFQTFSQSLVNCEFPQCLEQAELISVFKKDDKLDKSYYRPVSILQNLQNL